MKGPLFLGFYIQGTLETRFRPAVPMPGQVKVLGPPSGDRSLLQSVVVVQDGLEFS